MPQIAAACVQGHATGHAPAVQVLAQERAFRLVSTPAKTLAGG